MAAKTAWMALAAALLVIPPRSESALQFDGKNDSVSIERSAILQGANAVTLMMRVRGACKPGNLVASPVILHFIPTLGFYLRDDNGGNSDYLAWDTDISSSDDWRHIAAVWSNPKVGDGKMKLYVDGVRQDGELAYAGGTNGVLAGGSLRLAGVFNCNIGAFQGELEDVRIYRRELTANEIFAVYAGEGADGVTNSLALWYPLRDGQEELKNEGNVYMLQDKSGHDNHGKIMGAPVWKNSGDDKAAQRRREQVKAACDQSIRMKADCEAKQKSLAKWFAEHPGGDKKWRARFEALNGKFDAINKNEKCWTLDVWRGYDDLQTEIGLEELFCE